MLIAKTEFCCNSWIDRSFCCGQGMLSSLKFKVVRIIRCCTCLTLYLSAGYMGKFKSFGSLKDNVKSIGWNTAIHSCISMKKICAAFSFWYPFRQVVKIHIAFVVIEARQSVYINTCNSFISETFKLLHHNESDGRVQTYISHIQFAFTSIKLMYAWLIFISPTMTFHVKHISWFMINNVKAGV